MANNDTNGIKQNFWQRMSIQAKIITAVVALLVVGGAGVLSYYLATGQLKFFAAENTFTVSGTVCINNNITDPKPTCDIGETALPYTHVLLLKPETTGSSTYVIDKSVLANNLGVYTIAGVTPSDNYVLAFATYGFAKTYNSPATTDEYVGSTDWLYDGFGISVAATMSQDIAVFQQDTLLHSASFGSVPVGTLKTGIIRGSEEWRNQGALDPRFDATNKTIHFYTKPDAKKGGDTAFGLVSAFYYTVDTTKSYAVAGKMKLSSTVGITGGGPVPDGTEARLIATYYKSDNTQLVGEVIILDLKTIEAETDVTGTIANFPAGTARVRLSLQLYNKNGNPSGTLDVSSLSVNEVKTYSILGTVCAKATAPATTDTPTCATGDTLLPYTFVFLRQPTTVGTTTTYPTIKSVQADKDGKYSFTGVTPGTYSLAFDTYGFAKTYKNVLTGSVDWLGDGMGPVTVSTTDVTQDIAVFVKDAGHTAAFGDVPIGTLRAPASIRGSEEWYSFGGGLDPKFDATAKTIHFYIKSDTLPGQQTAYGLISSFYYGIDENATYTVTGKLSLTGQSDGTGIYLLAIYYDKDGKQLLAANNTSTEGNAIYIFPPVTADKIAQTLTGTISSSGAGIKGQAGFDANRGIPTGAKRMRLALMLYNSGNNPSGTVDVSNLSINEVLPPTPTFTSGPAATYTVSGDVCLDSNIPSDTTVYTPNCDTGETKLPYSFVYLIDSAGKLTQETQADKDGHYSFANVATGSYTIGVKAYGFVKTFINKLTGSANRLGDGVSVSVSGNTTQNLAFFKADADISKAEFGDVPVGTKLAGQSTVSADYQTDVKWYQFGGAKDVSFDSTNKKIHLYLEPNTNGYNTNLALISAFYYDINPSATYNVSGTMSLQSDNGSQAYLQVIYYDANGNQLLAKNNSSTDGNLIYLFVNGTNVSLTGQFSSAGAGLTGCTATCPAFDAGRGIPANAVKARLSIMLYNKNLNPSGTVDLKNLNLAPVVIPGDANGDGLVNRDDMRTIADWIVTGVPTDVSTERFNAADLADPKGTINRADLRAVVDIIAGF